MRSTSRPTLLDTQKRRGYDSVPEGQETLNFQVKHFEPNSVLLWRKLADGGLTVQWDNRNKGSRFPNPVISDLRPWSDAFCIGSLTLVGAMVTLPCCVFCYGCMWPSWCLMAA